MRAGVCCCLSALHVVVVVVVVFCFPTLLPALRSSSLSSPARPQAVSYWPRGSKGFAQCGNAASTLVHSALLPATSLIAACRRDRPPAEGREAAIVQQWLDETGAVNFARPGFPVARAQYTAGLITPEFAESVLICG